MAQFLLFRGLSTGDLSNHHRKVSATSARVASSLLAGPLRDAHQGQPCAMLGSAMKAVTSGECGGAQSKDKHHEVVTSKSHDEDWLWADMLSLGRD